MTTFLRGAALAVGAAATIVTTTTPASAATVTAVAFQGTVTFGCFGCGTYGPTGNGGTFWATGVVDGAGVLAVPGVTPPNGSATFTITASNVDPECVISDRVHDARFTFGSAFGPKTIEFTWTRIGAVLLLTIWGGGGTGTMTITDPIGDPCGKAVNATVSGTLAGMATVSP